MTLVLGLRKPLAPRKIASSTQNRRFREPFLWTPWSRYRLDGGREGGREGEGGRDSPANAEDGPAQDVNSVLINFLSDIKALLLIVLTVSITLSTVFVQFTLRITAY